MRQANYEIVRSLSNEQWLVIRDLGPHDKYATITNAADEVVAELCQRGELPLGRRLFYFDSEENVDELIVSHNGQRARFGGFRVLNQEWKEMLKLEA